MTTELKGDLFGKCEDGQHAWRPVLAADGYPRALLRCKWCGARKVPA